LALNGRIQHPAHFALPSTGLLGDLVLRPAILDVHLGGGDDPSVQETEDGLVQS
jgi:hypothetical protein